MIIYNENGSKVFGEFTFDYKGYEISVECDPSEKPKIFVSLNDIEVGVDPFNSEEGDSGGTLQGAIEWIDEDIRCRREEADYSTKCPHCERRLNASHIPAFETAEMNADSYGSSSFFFECPKCKERFGLIISRLTKIQEPWQVHKEHELSY